MILHLLIVLIKSLRELRRLERKSRNLLRMRYQMESQAIVSFLVDFRKVNLFSTQRLFEGAAISLYTGYQLKLTLGGVLALSGYLPNFNTMPTVRISMRPYIY